MRLNFVIQLWPNKQGWIVVKAKTVVRILLFTIALTLPSVSLAQLVGEIESMKLLTPKIGWGATNKKVFWTTDSGQY